MAKPRLWFYLEHHFPFSVGNSARFEVHASGDGGATWRTMLRLYAACSPARRRIVPLDAFAGSADVRIRFVVYGGENASLTHDGVYIDDIAACDAGDPVPEFREHIVENVDFLALRNVPPEFVELPSPAAWTYEFGYKSRAPRVSRLQSAWCAPGTPGAGAVYTPMFTTAGFYDVYATWGLRADAAGVRYGIAYAYGSRTVVLDQAAANNNRWVHLGRFWFGYGQDPARGSVTLDISGASGTRAYSDAVRFRLAAFDSASADAAGWNDYE